jgi:hypothetical protein
LPFYNNALPLKNPLQMKVVLVPSFAQFSSTHLGLSTVLYVFDSRRISLVGDFSRSILSAFHSS